jgi:hypothetical protein
LTGQTEHQIGAQVLEASRARCGEGTGNGRSRMVAADTFQKPILECLRAE